MALGYRFCLADPGATRSTVEQVLNQSLFQYTERRERSGTFRSALPRRRNFAVDGAIPLRPGGSG